MEITTGIRAILSSTGVYESFNALIGAKKSRRTFVTRYVRPKRGDRVLDIGCGPAEILEMLGDVDYVGFDANRNYIDAAKRKFGDRGTFFEERLTAQTTARFEAFDLVLVLGALHHMDDDEVRALLSIAKAALGAGGRLLTIDPCLRDGQSSVARFLIEHDRGRNVRTEQGYLELVRPIFPAVTSTIEESMMRIPYTHVVLVAPVGDAT